MSVYQLVLYACLSTNGISGYSTSCHDYNDSIYSNIDSCIDAGMAQYGKIHHTDSVTVNADGSLAYEIVQGHQCIPVRVKE